MIRPLALAALVAAVTPAPAPTPDGMKPLPMNPDYPSSSHSMPTCPQGDPMVWLVRKPAVFYLEGAARYGRGKGRYACESGALATGAISAPGQEASPAPNASAMPSASSNER